MPSTKKCEEAKKSKEEKKLIAEDIFHEEHTVLFGFMPDYNHAN